MEEERDPCRRRAERRDADESEEQGEREDGGTVGF